jgi:hypothetical protein
MNAQQTRGLDSPPSPLLCYFQLGKNEKKKWEQERNPDLLLRVVARVTVAAGSDERVNQANDRALIPFRQ